MNLTLYIADEYLHHHAKNIIAGNEEFVRKLAAALSNNIEIDSNPKLKEKKDAMRISAAPLNKAIRKLLETELPEIRTELFELDGVYYEGDATHGFDFAFIDEELNLLKLWNLCHGTRPYANGQERWADYVKKNQRISEAAAIYNQNKSGHDLKYVKKSPIILGEIQFGNWGLVYRDFFKVIKANTSTDVDLLVYITATGRLEKLLSDGIVTFNKTKQFLEANSKVVTLPTWVIALDIEELPDSGSENS